MTGNPVIEKLGRRLRLGVLGGGPGSVIGEVHRTAARLDDRYEVVAGVLSSNPERSARRRAGARMGAGARLRRRRRDARGRDGAPGRGGRGRDHDPQREPPSARLPLARRRAGRHLRQAPHHPPRRRPRPRRPGAGERPRLLHHLQLLPPIRWCGRRGRWSRTATSGRCGSPRSSTSSRSSPSAPTSRIPTTGATTLPGQVLRRSWGTSEPTPGTCCTRSPGWSRRRSAPTSAR